MGFQPAARSWSTCLSWVVGQASCQYILGPGTATGSPNHAFRRMQPVCGEASTREFYPQRHLYIRHLLHIYSKHLSM